MLIIPQDFAQKIARGETVTLFDDLSTGSRDHIDDLGEDSFSLVCHDVEKPLLPSIRRISRAICGSSGPAASRSRRG